MEALITKFKSILYKKETPTFWVGVSPKILSFGVVSGDVR
jgi:hypothetical protein